MLNLMVLISDNLVLRKSCWIIFIFIYLLIDIIYGFDTSGKDVSTVVKKRSIGWANPNEMLIDDASDDWVSLDDMLGYDKKRTQNAIPNEMEINNMRKNLRKHEVYMKRFINLFLRCSGLQEYNLQPGTVKQVKFEYIISQAELSVLQEFGYSGKGLTDVDAVLTKLFIPNKGTFFEHHSSRPERFNFPWIPSFHESFSYYISYISNSYEWIIILSVFTVWVTTLWVSYVTGKYRWLLANLFILLFTAGFCMTWIRMYQEAEAERFQAEMMNANAPPHCRSNDLSFFSHIYYSLFGEDCTKYYKTKLVHPFVKVAVTVVLSETISQMFLHPATYIGKAYGDFVTTATGSVPWYLKIVMVLFAYIIPLIFVFGIIILCMGYKINLNPLTGLTILPTFGGRKTVTTERNYIEEVLDNKKVQQKKRRELNMIESVVSNVKKPLILLNWHAFEKIKISKIPASDVDSEVKSITNESVSVNSDGVSVKSDDSDNDHAEKSEKQGSPKNTDNKSKIYSGGSGDSFEVTKQAKEREKESQKHEKYKQTKIQKVCDLDKTVSRSDVKSEKKPSSKDKNVKNCNVQQWLDDNCLP